VYVEATLGSLVVALLIGISGLTGNVYWTHVWTLVAIYTIAAVGLSVLKDSGQMSFAQGALIGISAYSAALLAADRGVSLPLALLAGVAISVLVGAVMSLPSLRVKGFYL